MKKEKYYEPEIEEFHIGFEYETMTSYGWDTVKYPEIGDTLGNAYEPWKGTVRVKHLDREDIESFGFEYATKYRDGGTEIYRTKCVDDEYLELEFYRPNIINSRDLVRIFLVESSPYRRRLEYHGFIKNKSELKRILKQTGVI